MLNKLSKDDQMWRRLAFNLCKDRQIADDLVQDMYIKMYNLSLKYPNKDVNSWYVYSSLRTIYFNYLKSSKQTISVDFCYTNTDNNNQDEPDTQETEGYKWVFKAIDGIQEDEYIYSSVLLDDRKLINSALEELSMYDREILLHTNERSLRANREYLGITVDKLFYGKKKALDKLLKTKGIKLLKNNKL